MEPSVVGELFSPCGQGGCNSKGKGKTRLLGIPTERDHELLRLGLARHDPEAWISMCLDRWLAAPIEKAEGRRVAREKGVLQGSAIGPLLTKLFLHYSFDKWMDKYHSQRTIERYADDIVVLCRSLEEAEQLLESIRNRLAACGLRLNKEKTQIVYCKQSNRKGDYPNVSFDFLGYTFKPHKVKTTNGQLKLGFSP